MGGQVDKGTGSGHFCFGAVREMKTYNVRIEMEKCRE